MPLPASGDVVESSDQRGEAPRRRVDRGDQTDREPRRVGAVEQSVDRFDSLIPDAEEVKDEGRERVPHVVGNRETEDPVDKAECRCRHEQQRCDAEHTPEADLGCDAHDPIRLHQANGFDRGPHDPVFLEPAGNQRPQTSQHQTQRQEHALTQPRDQTHVELVSVGHHRDRRSGRWNVRLNPWRHS